MTELTEFCKIVTEFLGRVSFHVCDEDEHDKFKKRFFCLYYGEKN